MTTRSPSGSKNQNASCGPGGRPPSGPRARRAPACRARRRRRRCARRRRCRRCRRPAPRRRAGLAARSASRAELAGSAAAPGAPGTRSTVTVVSPPHKITQGFETAGRAGARPRQRGVHLAHLARFALDLVAQDVRVEPRSRARRLQPPGDCCGVAIRCTSWPANSGSPGLAFPTRRCPAGLRRPETRSVARRMAARRRRCSASGTVGPLAMIDGSSPGTSLMSNVTTRAGAQRAASRPPLMATGACARSSSRRSRRRWPAAPG